MASRDGCVKYIIMLFETEGLHEQKINDFGKWLIGLENGFYTVARSLHHTFLFVAVVYLVFRGLAWLFNWPV